MDNLTYNYINGTNELDHINDAVAASNYPNDLDNQSPGNYTYDAIGELTQDSTNLIKNITWTVYGKINTITKFDGSTIVYTYDAAGNRISKTFTPTNGNPILTWYVRDAQGNILSVYTAGNASLNSGDLTRSEIEIYGAKRLGLVDDSTDVSIQPSSNKVALSFLDSAKVSTFRRGEKLFELSNHLDNVMVTLSDKKWGVTLNGTTVDHFNPQIVSANDYYPFGSQMPGRDTTFQGSNYRFGFNGKENDNEIKGVGNQQDYGMRIFDPRIGRFLSIDPITGKYPMLTPYQFSSNRPIDGKDIDGLEYGTVNVFVNSKTGKNTTTYTPYDPSQQNVTGPMGRGVQYNITIENGFTFNFFYPRNAELFQMMPTEYGNYYGSTSFYKVDIHGKFINNINPDLPKIIMGENYTKEPKSQFSYDIPAVDAVDETAKMHDQGYDRVDASGSSGLFHDWGTTPYDENAKNSWSDFVSKYKVGDKDPFTGQKITQDEIDAASNGKTLFSYVVNRKKTQIAKFMILTYRVNPIPGGGKLANSTDNNAREIDYQLFLKVYMTKDADGNWTRIKNMWDKDGDKYVPRTTPKT
jgi:RHS repeat-associated protein